MLSILIILGWLIAFACMVYLATHAIRNRFYARKRRKVYVRKVREFKTRHHFDEKHQRWIRNLDGEAVVDEASEDRRLMLALSGWLLLIAWEAYWILEIVNRIKESPSAWELPYFFLFVILVGIPLAVYRLFRRRMRHRRDVIPANET